MPNGEYVLSSTIAVRFNGQALFGQGTYTTTLVWVGTDSTKNMIEILSMRRDAGDLQKVRTGQMLSGFLLTTSQTAVLANMIWVESGVFHIILEKLRILVPGRPAEAVIKLESSGGYSYPVSPTLRNITITGLLNPSGLPVACGIWLESVIEGYFDRVVVYSVEEGWRIGHPTAGEGRIVGHCTFVRCQSEIGNRANATEAGVAVRLYNGVNLNFFSCEFNAGLSFTSSSTQRVMVFSNTDGIGGRAVTFNGCFFWGENTSVPAIDFDSTALFRDVTFNQPTIDCAAGAISMDVATDVNINWHNPSYVNTAPQLHAEFKSRGIAFDASSLNDGDVITTDLPDAFLAYGEPFLVSFSNDLQGVMLTAYKRTTSGLLRASFQNETGNTVSLGSGRLRWRAFAPREARASRTLLYDPPSLLAGARATTEIAMPGAQLGDFVVASFGVETTGGLNSIILTVWVSAANTATVQLQNLTATTTNFHPSNLTVYLLSQTFTAYGSVAYDPASLNDGSVTIVSVTVPGVQLGDFVVASFSDDLAGAICTGYVAAPDTVHVSLQNATGGTISLAAGLLAVGVYKRYTAL